MVERDEHGRLKSGSVLNPCGRGKKPEEERAIRDALHKAIPNAEVLGLLAEAIREKESWAITLYLAYDWGKPREQVDITHTDELTDDELMAIAAGRRA